MGSFIGIDYGTKRIGLAIADPEGILASPADTIAGTGNTAKDAANVSTWAREHKIDKFVIGLPINMDGSDSDQTTITRRFAAEVEKCVGYPAVLWDERLTSFQADELMAEANIKRGKRKAARDAIAALVILRSYLESQKSPPTTH